MRVFNEDRLSSNCPTHKLLAGGMPIKAGYCIFKIKVGDYDRMACGGLNPEDDQCPPRASHRNVSACRVASPGEGNCCLLESK